MLLLRVINLNDTGLEGLIESDAADDQVGDARVRGGLARGALFARVRSLDDQPGPRARERSFAFLSQRVVKISERARHPRRTLRERDIRAREIIVQRQQRDRMTIVFGERLPLAGEFLSVK